MGHYDKQREQQAERERTTFRYRTYESYIEESFSLYKQEMAKLKKEVDELKRSGNENI